MIVKKITSRSNPLIKQLLSVKKAKHEGVFLVEGLSTIKTALQSKGVVIEKLLFTEAFQKRHPIELRGLKETIPELIETDNRTIRTLSDTTSPQGIIAVVQYRQTPLDQLHLSDKPLLVILDGINDPGNLGTMIRSCLAFGVDAVILMPDTCNPFSSKVIRASAGAVFAIPIIASKRDEMLRFIKNSGIRLVITDPSAMTQVDELNCNRPIAFVFGNEAQGVSETMRQVADEIVSIAMCKTALDSLNVAIAGSIILYEVFKQRQLTL